jgi:hypothetical protein
MPPGGIVDDRSLAFFDSRTEAGDAVAPEQLHPLSVARPS